MTVVVTGSSGFIGTHVVRALLDRGERVVGLDRVPATVAHEDLEVVRVDLAHPNDDALEALRTADAVVHLAARPGVRDRTPGIERCRYRDNVVATEQVLAAVPPATYLVVASSSSVYGGASSGRSSREDDRLRPRGGYARSKVQVEARCARRHTSGGAVAVVRPFTVVGEDQRADMALARWITDARAGRPLTVYGSLSRSRDVTDVRDVVHALMVLLERGSCTTVNVGTGWARSLGELTTAVREVVAPVPVHVVRHPVREPRETRADTRRIRTALGFVPSTDVVDVVRRTANALDGRLRLVS